MREGEGWTAPAKRSGAWALGLMCAGCIAVACSEPTRLPVRPPGAGDAGQPDAPNDGATAATADDGKPPTGDAPSSLDAGTTADADTSVDAPVVEPFPGTPEQYWRALAETTRARRQECLGIRADADTLASNIVSATYVIEHEVTRRKSYLAGSLEAGRLRFDRSRAALCLGRVTTQSCEDFRRDSVLAPDCADTAMVGLVPRGGECFTSIDCVGGDDYCESLDGKTAHCAPRARLGEGCAFRACVDGARCPDAIPPLGQLDSLKCEPIPTVADGAPCWSAVACAAGSFCTVGSVCRAYGSNLSCADNDDCPYAEPCLIPPGASVGQCGPGRSEGAPCRRDALSRSDCAFPLDCRASGGSDPVCTDTWVGIGERCRNTGSQGGINCIDGTCAVEVRETQEGTCVPLGRLNEACYVGSCMPGLECTAANGCQADAH